MPPKSAGSWPPTQDWPTSGAPPAIGAVERRYRKNPEVADAFLVADPELDVFDAARSAGPTV